jgi:hypothetical protein
MLHVAGRDVHDVVELTVAEDRLRHHVQLLDESGCFMHDSFSLGCRADGKFVGLSRAACSQDVTAAEGIWSILRGESAPPHPILRKA